MDYEFISNNSDQTLIFLHGWGGDKRSFFLVKDRIKNLNLLFVSFPGFGLSHKLDRPYNLDDYANELKCLLDKLKINNKLNIICHSFGARVAAVFYKEYPQLVNKIMIVDGAGLKPKRSFKYYYKVWKYKKLKNKVQRGKLEPEILLNYGSEDYKKLNKIMKQTFVNVVNQDLKREFKNIKCETLLFWGELDKETPIYMAKRLKKLIKKSKMYVVKGGGHFSYLDDSDAFIYNLYNFFFN